MGYFVKAHNTYITFRLLFLFFGKVTTQGLKFAYLIDAGIDFRRQNLASVDINLYVFLIENDPLISMVYTSIFLHFFG